MESYLIILDNTDTCTCEAFKPLGTLTYIGLRLQVAGTAVFTRIWLAGTGF